MLWFEECFVVMVILSSYTYIFNVLVPFLSFFVMYQILNRAAPGLPDSFVFIIKKTNNKDVKD